MKTKIRYLGSAPGQADTIKVAGLTFTRGSVKTVSEKLAEALVAKGGFELLKKITLEEKHGTS
jgi:hypothetical protein